MARIIGGLEDKSSQRNNNSGGGMDFIICAMRGRDKDNPNYQGKSNGNFRQRLEPNVLGIANTISTLTKDNMVICITK